MSLANRTPPRRTGGTPCRISKLLTELDVLEREAFVAMLGNKEEWGNAAISEALTEEGHEGISAGSVGKCRRGGCAHCPTSEWAV